MVPHRNNTNCESNFSIIYRPKKPVTKVSSIELDHVRSKHELPLCYICCYNTELFTENALTEQINALTDGRTAMSDSTRSASQGLSSRCSSNNREAVLVPLFRPLSPTVCLTLLHRSILIRKIICNMRFELTGSMCEEQM